MSELNIKMPTIKVRNKKRKNVAEKNANGAIIYIRVSSEEQVKGFSLDGQEEECRRFAERNGYKIVKVFREEGKSAKTTKRDEFQKMMKFCRENKKQIKYIIVYRIDRFTRNILDLLNSEQFLEKMGIEILTVIEPNEKGYMGKFNRRINGLFAQLDNERRADSTLTGMKKGFLEGNWMWKAPYGYINDKNLRKIIPDKFKSKIVKKIFEKFATGCYTQKGIVSELKTEGVIIKEKHMCEMLRNPIYCGYMYKPEWCSEPIKGKFEAIVSEKTFNAVQDILDGRKPSIAPHDLENKDYPLKQFLVCPYCGKPLTGSNSISQRGKRLYQYYTCYNKECSSKNKEVCKSRFNVPKDVAEVNFKHILTAITPKNEAIDLFKVMVRDVYAEQTQEIKTTQSKLQKELDELLEGKKSLIRKYTSDKIQEEEYNMALEDYKARELEIKSNMINNDLTPQELNDVLKNSLSVIQNLSNAWDNSVLRIKKNIQKLIFPQGLRADFQDFQNSVNSTIFNKIDALSASHVGNIPPREFESLSTP